MTVRVESIGDAIVVAVERPETKNAIDAATAAKIGDAVRLAAGDPTVRGVVLTAIGDTFVSGGDLNELARLIPDPDGGRAVLEMFDAVKVIETCDVPVVAAIQGDVYGGGCELVLLCDLVIMEEQAHVAFRHAKMGLSPAWGGLTRLVERVGPLEASRLLFTAERIDAREALRIGLVNEVVGRGDAKQRALARIGRIADNPRATVAAMKRALREVREARRGDAAEIERAAFSKRWGAPDHQHAMRAFAAKKG